jgi:hypothetical protein
MWIKYRSVAGNKISENIAEEQNFLRSKLSWFQYILFALITDLKLFMRYDLNFLWNWHIYSRKRLWLAGL